MHSTPCGKDKDYTHVSSYSRTQLCSSTPIGDAQYYRQGRTYAPSGAQTLAYYVTITYKEGASTRNYTKAIATSACTCAMLQAATVISETGAPTKNARSKTRKDAEARLIRSLPREKSPVRPLHGQKVLSERTPKQKHRLQRKTGEAQNKI